MVIAERNVCADHLLIHPPSFSQSYNLLISGVLLYFDTQLHLEWDSPFKAHHTPPI